MSIYELTQPKTDDDFQHYFDLRWRLLRAPWDQPSGSERDKYEQSATTRHVAARSPDGPLLGVGRLHLNSTVEAQIRYMAVEPAWRGRGVGRAIVAELESFAAQQSALRVVLNARDDVIKFYQRLGFLITGPGPTMFDSIGHSRMAKQLST